jgi:hypothetical protein
MLTHGKCFSRETKKDLFLFPLLCLAFALVVWTRHNKSAVYLVLLDARLWRRNVKKERNFISYYGERKHNEPTTKKKSNNKKSGIPFEKE